MKMKINTNLNLKKSKKLFCELFSLAVSVNFVVKIELNFQVVILIYNVSVCKRGNFDNDTADYT